MSIDIIEFTIDTSKTAIDPGLLSVRVTVDVNVDPP